MNAIDPYMPTTLSLLVRGHGMERLAEHLAHAHRRCSERLGNSAAPPVTGWAAP